MQPVVFLRQNPPYCARLGKTSANYTHPDAVESTGRYRIFFVGLKRRDRKVGIKLFVVAGPPTRAEWSWLIGEGPTGYVEKNKS